MNNEFNILLRLARAQLTDEERQRPIKTVAWLYPLATEKLYYRKVSLWMKEYVNHIMEDIQPNLIKWIEQNETGNGWETGISAYRKTIQDWLLDYFGTGLTFDNELGRAIDTVATGIFNNAIRQWKKQTQVVLGMAYAATPDNWLETKNNWMTENYLDVRSLAEDYNNQLMSLIFMGLAASWSYDDFSEEIAKLNKRIIKNRSAGIARNRTGMLNGGLTRSFASLVGNDEYFWNTAKDERVRGNPTGIYPKAIPSHYLMEGTKGKWSNAAIYSKDGITWQNKTSSMETLPPGFAWGCRCTASMYWDNYVREQGGEYASYP